MDNTEQVERKFTVYVGDVSSAVEYYVLWLGAEFIFEGKNLGIVKWKDTIIRFEFWPEEVEMVEKTQWEKTKGILTLLGIKKDE